jgi:protein SCO1/2
MPRRLVMCVLAGFLLLSAASHADEQTDAAIARSQGVVGQQVPDFTFTLAGGKTVRLSDFRGKPLLVSLVYTGCSDVCPTVVESLAAARDVAEETFGDASFNIITVGFDTRNDTPERMQSFARAHGVRGDNWRFAAMSAVAVDDFAAAVGFDFAASAGGFEHAAQVTVLDGEGKVYSQIYGGTFQPPAVVEPLKSLIYGGARPVYSLAGLGDRIKLFCTVYDPRTGRYYFDYSLVLSVAIGAMVLAGMLVFLVREVRRSIRASRV